MVVPRPRISLSDSHSRYVNPDMHVGDTSTSYVVSTRYGVPSPPTDFPAGCYLENMALEIAASITTLVVPLIPLLAVSSPEQFQTVRNRILGLILLPCRSPTSTATVFSRAVFRTTARSTRSGNQGITSLILRR